MAVVELAQGLPVYVQLISAGLTWFLDGVYITPPNVTSQNLYISVRLRDTTSTLLTTGNYTLVQVSFLTCACSRLLLAPAPDMIASSWCCTEANDICAHALLAFSWHFEKCV